VSRGYYILDEHHNTKQVSLLEWGRWLERADTRVAYTKFECGVWISTVFLGLDHRFGDKGPPLLFETMVFEMTMEGGGDEMWRYSTWDDAETGHKAIVRRVKQKLEKAGLSTAAIAE